MDFYVESITFRPYPGPWNTFRSSKEGPIGSDLYRRGRLLQLLAKGSAPTETSALKNSIYLEYKAKRNPEVVVGSRLNYAYFVHEGTRPHVIRPNSGRVLRFKVGGKIVYARKVNHPGHPKPRKFLSQHLRTVVR